MASRYWVGGNGTWDATNTANWSASSGGASGASVPTNVDDVFVDALSGSSPVITLATAAASCLSLDFTGAITPTLAGSVGLNIFGSLTRIASMTWSRTGTTTFGATSTGKTITSAGGSFLNSIFFAGTGGGWTLQDALTSTSNINLSNGSLNTNGKAVSCSGFSGTGSSARTLTLGASAVSCQSWNFATTTNLTFNAGTSSITVIGAATFDGGGLTYNNVTFNSTTSTISGSNTFNVLTILATRTLKLTSGTTQTVTSLVCNGTLAGPCTLQSITAGSPATIALPVGRHFIRHTSVKDITISGATSLTDIAGTNVSGNTGITFVTKFEMGRIKNDGSFNWYSTTTGTVDKVSG